MAQAPLVAARLDFAEGAPFSAAYGDVYHSAEGGPAQARHVFLAGNGLPARWRGRSRFVILETGFGFGLNFLATWQAWRRDPERCGKLHFVSIEKHPFSLEDLRTLHARYPEFESEAGELHSAWPMLVPGGHRAELDDGKVVLTLFLGDIALARGLRLAADALYLDGFSPAKNPDMWSPATLRALSRLCAPGATAATWSVAAPVRAALEATGFAVEKAPGFGSKKEMIRAHLVRPGVEVLSMKNRTATVVGAGLAGAALCERLCARGWEVTLVERHDAPAQEASGNHAGSFHPVVTPDDSVFARLSRAGFFHALSTLKKLRSVHWDPCGVLQLARNEPEERSQRAAIAALEPPRDYAQWLSRDEASARAGVPVGAGGLWFPAAGWIRPRSLVDALLERCGPRLEKVFSKEIHQLASEKITILATGSDALHRVSHARLRRVRGQVSYVPAGAIEAPRVVVLRGGFALPAIEGVCVVGASFDLGDEDAGLRASSHAGNLERLRAILPACDPGDALLDGRVGFRWVAPDRLPLVGALGDGVYGVLALGSRGLLWSMLAAELLACRLDGEPFPVEGKLLDALDPMRFLVRATKRAAGPGSPSSRRSARTAPS